MPSRAITTLPGRSTVLVAFWVALVPCLGESSWLGCDNGKVLLDTDLPKDAVHWDCSTPLWTKSQSFYSVDTEYDPEPAKLTCMDQYITFNHTIPNSGPFRPVGAENGEYLFCPPQRWLHNLHRGATVLLYHPCTPLEERQLLSALAQSCISDYILTLHTDLDKNRPIALVSWGRTLEVSTASSPEICDWLNRTSSSKTNAGQTHKYPYNLFLTRSAEQDKRKVQKGSLKQCCDKIILSFTKDTKETQLHLQNLKQIKNREKRAAETSATNDLKISNNPASKHIHKLQSNGLPKTTSSPNIVDQSSAKDSESKSLKENPKNLTSTNNPPLIHAEVQLQKSSGNEMERNDNIVTTTARNKEIKPIAKHRSSGKVAANPEKNEVVEVEEREADNMKNAAKTHQTGSNGLDTSPKSQPVGSSGACQCKVDQPCECGKEPADQSQAAEGVRAVFQRTPRTDEAVWAAGALAFLLVLLTLSILHTRLYKNWRRGTSLYWHDPRQDYDSVADVIRRRLRLAKKRRKRSRKKECVLLPSSSSSEEYP